MLMANISVWQLLKIPNYKLNNQIAYEQRIPLIVKQQVSELSLRNILLLQVQEHDESNQVQWSHARIRLPDMRHPID